MNWDAIGAVGEILGAAAVVISLGYLAGQIKSNTRALRRAASRDAVAGVNEWFSKVTVDNDTANLFARGVESFSKLDPDEAVRFRFIYFQLFKVFEDLHFQFEERLLDHEQWEGWRWAASQYLASPGGREYWKMVDRAFSSRFRDLVETMQAETDFDRAGQFAERLREEAVTRGPRSPVSQDG